MRFFPIRPTPRPRRLSAVRHVHYLNATPQIFARQIANTDRLTLVDFYADWCGPCRALTPILKKLTSDSETLDLITIDTDQHFELAARYKVTGLPTVIAFRGGKPVHKFVGALPEPQVADFLATCQSTGVFDAT